MASCQYLVKYNWAVWGSKDPPVSCEKDNDESFILNALSLLAAN